MRENALRVPYRAFYDLVENARLAQMILEPGGSGINRGVNDGKYAAGRHSEKRKQSKVYKSLAFFRPVHASTGYLPTCLVAWPGTIWPIPRARSTSVWAGAICPLRAAAPNSIPQPVRWGLVPAGDSIRLRIASATSCVRSSSLVPHVLQGTIHHSENGILKERWSDWEIAQMAFLPLAFTPSDALLVQQGTEKRRSHAVSNPFTRAPTNRSEATSLASEGALAVP